MPNVRLHFWLSYGKAVKSRGQLAVTRIGITSLTNPSWVVDALGSSMSFSVSSL